MPSISSTQTSHRVAVTVSQHAGPSSPKSGFHSKGRSIQAPTSDKTPRKPACQVDAIPGSNPNSC